MLNKFAIKNHESPTHANSPIVIRKSSYSSAQKSNNFDPQANLHSMAGFPIRSAHKNSSDNYRHAGVMTIREASIDQIKSKLKEYLRKTQQNSLLNYQNESVPEFTRKSIHQNFRMTLFRNNLKKKINLKIIEPPFAERYESTPEFNVSEAQINPRAQKILDQNSTGTLFHPKREYFIHHHQKKKEKIPIPRLIPPKTVYPLTNRESSYRQRQRGGLGVQPWRRWGRESEEGDLAAAEDP